MYIMCCFALHSHLLEPIFQIPLNWPWQMIAERKKKKTQQSMQPDHYVFFCLDEHKRLACRHTIDIDRKSINNAINYSARIFKRLNMV